MTWHLTFDIWRLLICKIYWDFTWSTEISKDLLIWHYTFDICYLTLDIWRLTFDVWHLIFVIDIPWHWYMLWHLTFDIDIPGHWYAMTFNIWHWYTMTFDIWHLTEGIDSTSTWYWNIFTDGFWGYLQSKKIITHWPNNKGLRDASASKNRVFIERLLSISGPLNCAYCKFDNWTLSKAN